nr:serine acetyltransferase [uncultured Capnocytophaga sp.]
MIIMDCAKLLIEELYQESKQVKHHIGKKRITSFVEELFQFFFLIDKRTCLSKANIEAQYEELRYDFTNIVADFLSEEKKKQEVGSYYDCILPAIYNKLKQDAQYIIDSDPAAASLREVQSTYPGFFAIMVYRIAHELWERGIPLLPRILTEYAHSKTGIDIHPGAKIGVPFMIDHGTGIVIGETTVIGDYVKLYQGVTLGALSVSVDKAHTKRHPTIEDNVVIYSGATILGGETVIGHDSIIGGNVWLTNSIEPFTKVFHKSQIIVKDNMMYEEPINFVI